MSTGSDGTVGIPEDGMRRTRRSAGSGTHSPLIVSSADWMHLVRTE